MTEIGLNMVRIASRFEIALVTGVTIGRRAGIARGMTRSARRIYMLARKRERGITVVER